MKFKDIDCNYKQIKGYEDYYITENGDIYSARQSRDKKDPDLKKMKPKNPGKAIKYFNIILANDQGHKTFSIHRLVAEYFVDGYFEGAVVNHIDGDNRNNKASNLEWVTQKENIHKSYATSNVDQTRNYIWWELYDSNGNMLGVFKGHVKMAEFIRDNNIPASQSSLTKYGKCEGFYVTKFQKVS